MLMMLLHAGSSVHSHPEDVAVAAGLLLAATVFALGRTLWKRRG